MNIRPADFVFFGMLLLLAGWPRPLLAAAPVTETVMRVHWQGMKQISADTNAANFMSVWQLPPTTALLAQTFDKLSRWPGNGVTNAVSARLRPLLDDLVASECYLEVSAVTNSQLSTLNSQLLLAIHLPAGRAGFWRTNLAEAIEARTGVHPVPTGDGWMAARSHEPARIEFSTAGEWTLVGRGLDTNISPTEFAARILHEGVNSKTNVWLEADLNLPCFIRLFSSSAKEDGGGHVENSSTLNSQLSTLPFSDLHLTAAGEAGDVVTRATLDLARPLDAPLPAWDVPTNLIHGPLTSFTAVRGFSPWLAGLAAWQKLPLNPPPDQAFFWAQEGVPFLTYCAAPLPAASNHLTQLAGFLVSSGNPWLATNGEGSFQWQTNPPNLNWKGALILSPFLQPVRANQHDFVLGGLCLSVASSNPPPAEMLRPVSDGPAGLVYYQSEQTGQRIEDGVFINQMLRLVLHRPQLPGNSAAALWLRMVGPRLGDTTTVVTRMNAQQLSLIRHSTLGLTALEWHLLADWLESPRFPSGMYSQ
ncbi:MAG TPA: hypothetical protein VNN22_19760 [Verrucomicrobiae bacterium]|nr:hypothetical protein [Verrucomicrobiae bacterium]